MLGFPALRELWGDDPLPPPPPGPRPYGAIPTWPPWAGPVVDAAAAEAALVVQRTQEGKSPPAHRFSEYSSPPISPWWPAAIQQLHDDADREARQYKYNFAVRHPPRHRVVSDPEFRSDRTLLHARLACTEAVFLLRTRVQEGMTAAHAAHLGAVTGLAAAAAAEYTLSILADDFLALWVGLPVEDVVLWGTPEDPRQAALIWGGGVRTTVVGETGLGEVVGETWEMPGEMGR
ncbi:hypothetical protein B0H12DRAFT_1242148 [Mycena haematopus]|nr:hypothetical protein B0H12DRAFT_1242148 [Mycena haematopus]